MAAACAVAGIEFISGTELTAESQGTELHLLGYCVALDNEKFLTEVGRFQLVRQNRIREMVRAERTRMFRCRSGRGVYDRELPFVRRSHVARAR